MERTIFARGLRRRPGVGWTLGLIWVVGLATIHAAAWASDPGAGDNAAVDPDGDVQVLTQGPVHEAFAAPVVNDPAPGLVVPKAPPEPIEEMPPDQKPAGENVEWISGYWSWDESRDDFVWISGVWREPPPGRQWVPGYWNQTDQGHQWVPGAWIPIEAEQNAQVAADAATAQGPATYLPAPPASLEVGPNVPSPSGNVFWSPGCWYWRHTRYVWRPGFWTVARPNWIWAPAHYIWTPGGYLFVEGYWDLPLANRGMLFAPVYYARPVYLRPAYVYTPMITIATPGLMANLFVQPRYNHYVFGDFYDRRFLSVGIFPWFSFTRISGPRRPVFYDPLFAYYSAIHAPGNPGWAAARRANYALLRDNVGMRPPRTYIEQTRIVQNNININRNITVVNPRGRPSLADRELGRPIAQVAARRDGPDGLRMERISAASRQQMRERSVRLAEFRTQRAGNELRAASRPGPGPGPGPGAGPGPNRPIAGAPGGARPRDLAQAAAAPRARPFAMAQSPIAARSSPNRPQRPALQAGGSTPTPSRPAPPRLDRQAAQARADMPNTRRDSAPQRPANPERPQPQPRPQQQLQQQQQQIRARQQELRQQQQQRPQQQQLRPQQQPQQQPRPQQQQQLRPQQQQLQQRLQQQLRPQQQQQQRLQQLGAQQQLRAQQQRLRPQQQPQLRAQQPQLRPQQQPQLRPQQQLQQQQRLQQQLQQRPRPQAQPRPASQPGQPRFLPGERSMMRSPAQPRAVRQRSAAAAPRPMAGGQQFRQRATAEGAMRGPASRRPAARPRISPRRTPPSPRPAGASRRRPRAATAR